MNIPKHSQYSNWAPAQNNNNLKNVKKFHENEVYYGRYSGQYYNKTQILDRCTHVELFFKFGLAKEVKKGKQHS